MAPATLRPAAGSVWWAPIPPSDAGPLADEMTDLLHEIERELDGSFFASQERPLPATGGRTLREAADLLAAASPAVPGRCRPSSTGAREREEEGGDPRPVGPWCASRITPGSVAGCVPGTFPEDEAGRSPQGRLSRPPPFRLGCETGRTGGRGGMLPSVDGGAHPAVPHVGWPQRPPSDGVVTTRDVGSSDGGAAPGQSERWPGWRNADDPFGGRPRSFDFASAF